MKKQVVKTMSIGLSALTLASSMSITAFADEAQDIKTTIEPAATETAETAQIVAPMNDDSEVADNKNDVKDEDDQKALDLLAENAAAEQAKAQAEAAKGGNVTVPEAQNQVAVAEEAVKNTEIIKNQAEIDVQNAQAAYDAAQAAVKAAEDKLTEIEKECFGEDGIKDDAKAAYDAANAIVNQAQGILIDAEDKLCVAKRKQNDAYVAYETAKTVAYYAGQALDYANANVTKKEDAKKVADENYLGAVSKLQEAANNKDAADKAVKAAQDEKTGLENQIGALEEQIKALNGVISTNESMIEYNRGLVRDAGQKIAAAEQALETAKKEYGPNSQAVKDIETIIAGLTFDIEETNAANKTLQSEIDTLQETVRDLTTTKATEDAKLTTLNTELGNLQAEAGKAETLVKNLTKLSELAEAAKAAKDEYDKFDKKETSYDKEIETINGQYKGHECFEGLSKEIETIIKNRSERDGDRGNWTFYWDYGMRSEYHRGALDDNVDIARALIKYYIASKYTDIDITKLSFSGLNEAPIYWEASNIEAYYDNEFIGYFNFDTRKDGAHIDSNYKNADNIELRLNHYNILGILARYDDLTSLTSFKSTVAAYNAAINAQEEAKKLAKATAESTKTEKETALNNFFNEHQDLATQYKGKDIKAILSEVATALADANSAKKTTDDNVTLKKNEITNQDNVVTGLTNKINRLNQQIEANKTSISENNAHNTRVSEDLGKYNSAKTDLVNKFNAAQQAFDKVAEENLAKSNEAGIEIGNLTRLNKENSDQVASWNSKIDDLNDKLDKATTTLDGAIGTQNQRKNELDAAWSDMFVAHWIKKAAASDLSIAKTNAVFAKNNKDGADKAVSRTENALNTAKANKVDAQTAYNTAKADHTAAVATKNKVVDAIDVVMNLRTQAGIAKTAVDAMEASLDAIVASYNASVTALAQTQTNLTEAQRLQAERDAEYEAARRRAAYARAAAQAALEAETEEVVIADVAVPTAAPTHARRAVAAAATTIEDAQTPLAGDAEESVEAKDSKDEVATITDEKTPLATTEQNRVISRTWWAWLVLAVAAIAAAVAYSKKKLEDKLSK